MSRIGRLPISVPGGVDVKIDGQLVTVKGPKGELSHTIAEPIGQLGQAVRIGLGWGMLPEPQARADLAAGVLIRLSPEAIDVPLHWQRWRLDSPRLAALTEAVRAAAARHLLRAGAVTGNR